MKISTSYMFDRAGQQMSTLQAKLVQSQNQAATGKQVVKPSDDPNRVATIERLNALKTRQDNYLSNMGLVKTRLDTEESAVKNASELMFRVKELTVQGSNDTMSPPDRRAIATELQGLRDQLLSLANSKDTNGNYLFSGSRVSQAPFEPPPDDPLASPVYQGDKTRMQVMIGDQRALSINRPGSDVFARVLGTDSNGQPQARGFFEALDDLIAGVKDGTRIAIDRGNGDVDQMLEGLNLAQANIGTDQAVLEQQTSATQDTLTTLQLNLSDVQDLDYAKAISEMNKQMLSLEAAQSSFSKISQLSLFQFLR